jgi:RimJ/RimL family protein N-acetyltransferase
MGDAPDLVDIPAIAALTDPRGWLFGALARVARDDSLDRFGDADLAPSAQGWLVRRGDQTRFERRWVLAVESGGPGGSAQGGLGVALLDLPLVTNLGLANLMVCVHPSQRRRGIGSALVAWAEHQARAAGRAQLVVWAPCGRRDDQPPYGLAPGGTPVPVEAPNLRFGLARGFALAQAMGRAVLDWPAPGADPDSSSPVPPPSDYRLHSWVNQLPERWVEQYGELRTVFSRDAPQAGVEWQPEAYDRSRIARLLQARADQGEDFALTVVEHQASQRLVGFTELTWPRGAGRWADQGMTVVRREHRGLGLAGWMKRANLQAMTRVRPEVRRVHCDVAGDNPAMRAVNQALGFRPDGVYVLLAKALGGSHPGG